MNSANFAPFTAFTLKFQKSRQNNCKRTYNIYEKKKKNAAAFINSLI